MAYQNEENNQNILIQNINYNFPNDNEQQTPLINNDNDNKDNYQTNNEKNFLEKSNQNKKNNINVPKNNFNNEVTNNNQNIQNNEGQIHPQPFINNNNQPIIPQDNNINNGGNQNLVNNQHIINNYIYQNSLRNYQNEVGQSLEHQQEQHRPDEESRHKFAAELRRRERSIHHEQYGRHPFACADEHTERHNRAPLLRQPVRVHPDFR